MNTKFKGGVRHLLALLALVASTANASYIDYGYDGSYNDLKEDVSMLAQASLLLKESNGDYINDKRLERAIEGACAGITFKWEKTRQPTIQMKRLKSKADQVCAQWDL